LGVNYNGELCPIISAIDLHLDFKLLGRIACGSLIEHALQIVEMKAQSCGFADHKRANWRAILSSDEIESVS
jgi:hypothetical protein